MAVTPMTFKCQRLSLSLWNLQVKTTKNIARKSMQAGDVPSLCGYAATDGTKSRLDFIVVIVFCARHWLFLKKRMRLRWFVTADLLPFLLCFS
jgi:hypothetical protein